MRIGLFTDTYMPDINGVVTSVKALKEGLENEGHTVFVITTHPLVTKNYLEDNVLYLPGLELKFLYGYKLSSPIHLQAMNVIKEMDLDIVHTHSEFGIGIFGRIVAKYYKLPMISTYHTQYEDYTHYLNVFNLKTVDTLGKKAVAKLSRMYAKNLQAIIAPSSKTKEMLLRYDIQKEISVIPTGLNFDKFKTHDEENIKMVKEKHNLDGYFVITYVGRIAQEKSIDLGIEGFAELLKRRNDVKMMIVGGGPQVNDLKELADKLKIVEHIEFVGPVSPDLVPAYYQASNAFVSASLTETQGLTYIEALASGIGVFARFDKPLEEIIIDNETGFIFEDAISFAEKVDTYIEMSEGEKTRLRSNIDAVLYPYDLQVFAKSVLSVYEKAIDRYFGKYVIESIQEEEDSVQVTLLQDGQLEHLTFDTDLFDNEEMMVGMEISRNDIISFEEKQKINEAMQIALKRIALRDYTELEITDHIRTKMNVSDEELEVVLERLRERRLVDDLRYLKEKVSYFRYQNRGNKWITDDLLKRGLNIQDIEDEISNEPREDYIKRGVERAESFLRRNNDGSTMGRINKLKEHLVRQGYEFDVLDSIIMLVEDDYDKEDELESLRKVINQAFKRYERKFSGYDLDQKVIKSALSKGYAYSLVKKVMEENEQSED